MATSAGLRIGIAGCGHAARIHLARLCALSEVIVVGCTDPDIEAARSLASLVPPERRPGAEVPAFADHEAMLQQADPDVAGDLHAAAGALPAGDGRPASRLPRVRREAAVHECPGGQRHRQPGPGAGLAGRGWAPVSAQLRPCGKPAGGSTAGAIGPLRLVTATLALPWLETHSGPEESWRLDPKVAGGGILTDAGDHLVDALLWTTGRTAAEVAAFQDRTDTGLDLVTTADDPAGRRRPGDAGPLGGFARLRSSKSPIMVSGADCGPPSARSRKRAGRPLIDRRRPRNRPRASTPTSSVPCWPGDPPCCPAEAAVETVRLLEAIARSAASGQVVRPS